MSIGLALAALFAGPVAAERATTRVASARAAQAAQAPGASLELHDCFALAGRRYGVDPQLLRAIALVESDLRADAINTSHATRTATVDIGLMQVNSAWLPTLRPLGIGYRQLLEPCTNIHVGAWILAGGLARDGNTWSAVGAYNAACRRLDATACARVRSRYAWRVWSHMAGQGVAGAGAPQPQRLDAARRTPDTSAATARAT